MVSGFVALTLSPMMCSLLLKHQERHSWIYNTIEGWINAVTGGYRRALTATLHARWLVAIVWVVVLGLGVMFFTLLKSELAPTEDRGVVFGLVTSPQGSTRNYVADQIRPIEEFYSQVPEAAAYHVDPGLPHGRRRQRDPAAEAVGGAQEKAAADHRRNAAQARIDPGRHRVSRSTRRRSGSRSAQRPSSTS